MNKQKTAEELFLEKFGNKITASESWVIRFAEEYANQLHSEVKPVQSGEVIKYYSDGDGKYFRDLNYDGQKLTSEISKSDFISIINWLEEVKPVQSGEGKTGKYYANKITLEASHRNGFYDGILQDDILNAFDEFIIETVEENKHIYAEYYHKKQLENISPSPELERLQKENDELKYSLQQSENNLKCANEDVKTNYENWQSMCSERAYAHEMVDDLKSDYAILKNSYEDLQNIDVYKTKELASLKKEYDNLSKGYDDWHNKYCNLKSQLCTNCKERILNK